MVVLAARCYRRRTTRFSRARILPAILVLWMGAVAVRCGSAAAAPGPEYDVKAAFLYNFAKFVEWPSSAYESSESPFVIGIAGKDPFGSVIDKTVDGKSIAGHPFAVRRLQWGQDLRNCQILFISAAERERISQALQGVKGGSVLTVGETPGFAKRGGVINFYDEDGRIRFEVNPEAAKRAHLTISSKLLSLARIVRDG